MARNQRDRAHGGLRTSTSTARFDVVEAGEFVHYCFMKSKLTLIQRSADVAAPTVWAPNKKKEFEPCSRTSLARSALAHPLPQAYDHRWRSMRATDQPVIAHTPSTRPRHCELS